MEEPYKLPHMGRVAGGIMEGKGMTQAELARRTGYSRARIGELLRNAAFPLGTVARLSIALGTNLFAILGGSLPVPPPDKGEDADDGTLESVAVALRKHADTLARLAGEGRLKEGK